VNTGEVCWGPATNGLPFQACDDDSVTVTLSGLPPTGGEGSWSLAAFGFLTLLAGAAVVAARRRQVAAEATR
jgi:LPXTG-motif cell wall-anchored protein